jgi:hypothetical protein
MPDWVASVIISSDSRVEDRSCAEKGLRDRNSPTCTLSQNGYGDKFMDRRSEMSIGVTDALLRGVIVQTETSMT